MVFYRRRHLFWKKSRRKNNNAGKDTVMTIKMSSEKLKKEKEKAVKYAQELCYHSRFPEVLVEINECTTANQIDRVLRKYRELC